MKIFRTGFSNHTYINNPTDSASAQYQPPKQNTSDTFVRNHLHPNTIKPSNPSFKGIFSYLFKEKDTYLTKEEVIKTTHFNKRNKNILLNYILTQNGYSQNRLDKFLALNERVKNFDNTIALFKNCQPYNKKFDETLYKKLIKLLDTGYNYDLTNAIRSTAFNNKTKKYNYKILDTAIKYYPEFKEKTAMLINHSCLNGGVFQPEVFNFYAKAVKNKELKPEQVWAYTGACSFYPEINVDALPKALELSKMFNSYRTMQKLMTPLHEYGIPEQELLDSITENIPDSITDLSDKEKYIYERLKVSRGVGFQRSLLIKESYDFFNNLYKKYNDNNIIEYISAIAKNYKDSGSLNKSYAADFLLTAAEYMPAENLKTISHNISNTSDDIYPKAAAILHGLKKEEKKDFDKILTMLNHSKNEISIKNLEMFQEEYQKHKDKYSAVFLAKRIDTFFLFKKWFNYNNEAELKKMQDYFLSLEDEESLNFYIVLINMDIDNIDNSKYAKELLNAGFDKKDIFTSYLQLKNFYIFPKNIKEMQQVAEEAKRLKDSGIDSVNSIVLSFMNPDNRKQLLDIRDEAIKRKNILAPAGEDLTNEDIDKTFLGSYSQVLKMLEVLGKDAFLYSFGEKIDNVEDYLEIIGELDKSDSSYERLLQITNPVCSELYKKLTAEINAYKAKLKAEPIQENKKEWIALINTTTKTRTDLINNAIKDPKEKLETVSVYAALKEIDNKLEQNERNPRHQYIDDILPYMNPKTEQEKELYFEKLNNMVFNALNIDTPSKETLQKLSLQNSKYLPKLFNTGNDFSEYFSELIDVLHEDPGGSTLKIFNELPQNIKTKEMFQEWGLNYDNWVKHNPDSKIVIKIQTDLEKQRQSAIRNLEADLNDELFKKLPEEETQKFLNSLKDKGFQLLEKDEAVYEGDGFLNGTKKVLRLYKNDMPVQFEDLVEIIKIIKEEINKNEFWNKKCDDDSVDKARETIKNHLMKLRYNEIKTASKQSSDKEMNIVIQKADMNDIKHSLFLGNDAACCTAVGTGCNEWSAPSYIMNKLISCIEVKDKSTYAGNTMMFIANINGKPSLVLDNIELKPKYQYNDKIRDAIIEYAKMVAKELGKPKMPIYAGPNRHKVNLDKFPLNSEDFSIIGSTGDDEIYLDFDSDSHQIDDKNEFTEKLYKIR